MHLRKRCFSWLYFCIWYNQVNINKNMIKSPMFSIHFQNRYVQIARILSHLYACVSKYLHFDVQRGYFNENAILRYESIWTDIESFLERHWVNYLLHLTVFDYIFQTFQLFLTERWMNFYQKRFWMVFKVF